MSARAACKKAREAARPRPRWRRFFLGVAWYLIPVVLVLSTAGYTYAALVIHVNPPVVAIEGSALRPTLRSGELVVLAPVRVDAVAKGELVAVRIATATRETYNLPATMIQRVVRIEHTPTGRVFITEARRGGLEFTTPASDVVGRPRFIVPLFGYAFRFATSIEGVIFLVALVIIWFLYYLFGVIDERRRRRRVVVVGEGAVSATSNDVPPAVSKEPVTVSLLAEPSHIVPAGTRLRGLDIDFMSDPVPVIAGSGPPDAAIESTQASELTRRNAKESRSKDAKADESSEDLKKRKKRRKKKEKKRKLKVRG